MRFIVSLLLLLGITSSAFGQLKDLNVRGEKDSCYFRFKTSIKVVDGKEVVFKEKMTDEDKRYAEWECGGTPGVIDCNNDLTYDEGSNIVFKKNNDLSNIAGSDKPYTGRCESCHGNGRVERRVNFVNGKENGNDTTYYRSGCPQIIRELVQGVEHGRWLYYYDSTQFMAWEMNFSMGKKHGRHIFFSKSKEDTTKWENYEDGLLHGVKRTYYSGSRIRREINYDHGVLNGPFQVFNIERVVIEDLNYKNGEKDQEWNYYYDDGELLKTESWKMGVKNGEFKMFYYGGQIQKSENYKKGRKEGWFEEFYPDSKTKNRRFFEKDELKEEHRYDEHGRETYSFGTPTGDEVEDDEMPTTGKKKKKKRRRKKKTKSKEEG